MTDSFISLFTFGLDIFTGIYSNEIYEEMLCCFKSHWISVYVWTMEWIFNFTVFYLSS